MSELTDPQAALMAAVRYQELVEAEGDVLANADLFLAWLREQQAPAPALTSEQGLDILAKLRDDRLATRARNGGCRRCNAPPTSFIHAPGAPGYHEWE